jgi:hypothetical protein
LANATQALEQGGAQPTDAILSTAIREGRIGLAVDDTGHASWSRAR